MIDINTIAVSKGSKSGGGTKTFVINNNNAGSEYEFEPHYLWGQYFDDTSDISGDLTGVGNIVAEGNVNAASFTGTQGTFSNLTATIQATLANLLATNITTDNLTVTQAAHFFKLVIDEIKSTQGQILITPASATIDKVLEDEDSYVCYFRTTDGDRQINNMFVTNDQIVCQTFNVSSGTSYATNNKFYWRKCISVGRSTFDENGKTVAYHFVELSKTDRSSNTNGVPSVGDVIVQLGNRTTASRQNAIVISAYNNSYLDAIIQAPSIVQYAGINDYELATHRLNVISNGLNMFKGSFSTTAGDDISQLITNLTVNVNGLTSAVGKIPYKNWFSFNNGIKFDAPGTYAAYPYGYGFWGTGSYIRVYNIGTTDADKNSDWTVTFEIKSSSDVTVTPNMCDISADKIYKDNEEQSSLNTTTSWTKYTCHFYNLSSEHLSNTLHGFFDIDIPNSTTTVSLRNVAIIKGRLINPEFYKSEEDMNFTSTGSVSWELQNINKTNETFKGQEVYATTSNPTSSGFMDFIKKTDVNIKDKTPYTLSFWARCDNNDMVIQSFLYNGSWGLCPTNNYVEYQVSDGYNKNIITSEWKYYTIHWVSELTQATPQTDDTYKNIKTCLAVRINGSDTSGNTTGTLYICGVDFYEGWNESQNNISSVIKQTNDNILLQVQNCGINIDNNSISLNGNTVVNGMLNINNENIGFTINGATGKTNITGSSVGTYNSFIRATSQNIGSTSSGTVKCEFREDVVDGVGAEYISPVLYDLYTNLGAFTSGQNITINSVTQSYNRIASHETWTATPVKSHILVEIVNAGTTYTLYDGYSTSNIVTINQTFTVNTSGTCIARITITPTFRTDTWELDKDSYTKSVMYNISYSGIAAFNSKTSLIGYDGMYWRYGNNNFLFCNSEGFYTRYGNNGIRVTPSSMLRLTSTGDWVPITYDHLAITTSTSYYVPDDVDIVVLKSSSSSSAYVYFPDPDSSSFYVGRKIMVKNMTAHSAIITTEDGETKYFVDVGSRVANSIYLSLSAGEMKSYVCDGANWIDIGY